MVKIGFIGTGNMGGALARAAAKNKNNELLLTDALPGKAEELAAEIGGKATNTAGVIAEADYIFLGIKPQMIADALAAAKEHLAARSNRFILVSMVVATPISRIREMAGGAYPVIRIMPNTPVSVGEGMVLYDSDGVTEEETAAFLTAMNGAGRFSHLPEKLIDAGTAVSGCGPAFVDLFVEALADGGVACGLPRPQAQEFAAQMVVGSARLILESGKHPGELKDMVCSPGGTTIQGVRALEEAGFRGAVIDAVIAAYEKNFDL